MQCGKEGMEGTEFEGRKARNLKVPWRSKEGMEFESTGGMVQKEWNLKEAVLW